MSIYLTVLHDGGIYKIDNNNLDHCNVYKIDIMTRLQSA